MLGHGDGVFRPRRQWLLPRSLIPDTGDRPLAALWSATRVSKRQRCRPPGRRLDHELKQGHGRE